ncbi:protein FAM221B isoform 2-T2 [Discoglossus pictus]
MSQELLQGEGGAECESPPAGTDVPIDGAGTSQIDSEEPLSPQEEAKSITKKPLAGSRSFTNKPPGGAKENFPAGTRFSATPQSGAKSRARGYKKPAEDQTKNGLYVGWRCPEYRWDCFRLGENAKCFCGHFLSEHQNFTGHETKLPCCVGYCGCQSFSFIPSCPEEVGEMWLRSKYGFDPKTWKAKCVCKHSHEDHLPTGSHACRARGTRDCTEHAAVSPLSPASYVEPVIVAGRLIRHILRQQNRGCRAGCHTVPGALSIGGAETECRKDDEKQQEKTI